MSIQAQKYEYKVDLNKIENDLLEVELKMPAIKRNKVTFHLPKMVPGTYAVYNFGRFVTEFKAIDKDGKEMEVVHSDVNTWEIKKAKNCAKITYKVEDTWDTDKPNVIFEPAGINFDVTNNVFVFNNHGIFGYFKKFEKLPYQITVDRPKELFGGTSMKRIGGDEDTDVFETGSYNSLVDNPILFAKPDTAMIKVGKADVLIHNYSPTGKVKAAYLVEEIKPILEAQRAYLGGELPVDKYAFLIFLNQAGEMYLSGAAGALEHSYSSFYAMFEGEPAAIGQQIRDVAAHEFFHIVTPLSVHSEEIHNFDFINPEMSKHLWLYEGGTEYAAQHVQVKQGLMPIEQFLSVMGDKMRNAERFDQSLSFTEMSKTCLDKNKSQYTNVYLKGALINMCLDLELRTLTNGEYGTQKMMQDLSQKYGIEKPFKDKCLFIEIAKLSGHKKEVMAFFDKYVAGTTPLPIKELVAKAGITYKEKGMVKELSPFGLDMNRGVTFNVEKKKIEVLASGIDQFGKDILKLEGGDLLHKWNGSELTMASVQQVLTEYMMGMAEGKELNIVVLRKDKEGVYQEVALSGKLQKMPVEVTHAFSVDENPSEEQMKIRKAWLGDYTTGE
jgi:predicted metalloprotease with PDZ domain